MDGQQNKNQDGCRDEESLKEEATGNAGGGEAKLDRWIVLFKHSVYTPGLVWFKKVQQIIPFC